MLRGRSKVNPKDPPRHCGECLKLHKGKIICEGEKQCQYEHRHTGRK